MSIIKLEKIIQATPAEVFPYFTNSTALRDWLCDLATTDPRVGGRMYLWWTGDYYSSGEFLKLEQDKLVSLIWFGRGEPHATQVDVTFKSKKAGTLLSGLPIENWERIQNGTRLVKDTRMHGQRHLKTWLPCLKKGRTCVSPPVPCSVFSQTSSMPPLPKNWGFPLSRGSALVD